MERNIKNTTNTIEEMKEEETMFYWEQLDRDITEWIRDNVDLTEFDSREELEQKLNDDLWIEDSVTGNASGSYTFSREEAKKNVLRDPDLISEMAEEFGIEAKEIGERFLAGDWEWFDVSIRCYLLGGRISAVLDRMEDRKELPF